MSITVTTQSQLMKNHVAGKVLPTQRQLAVAKSSDSLPFLFALDTEGQFIVMIPSSTSSSGWEEVNLGIQVPNATSEGISAFSVSQGYDGSIWIALATAAAAMNGAVYVSTAVSAASSKDEWSNFGSKLIKRELPSGLKVNSLTLGVAVRGNPTPLLIVTASDAYRQIKHYQVNPNPSDKSWTMYPLIMPQNATACLGCVPGYLNQKGLGVYTLCSVGMRTALTFTPLPTFYQGHPVIKPALDLGIPSGVTLSAIAAEVLQDGQTELYSGGSGLWYYNLSSQSTSNLLPATIDDGTYFKGVKHLKIASEFNGSQVGVWGITAADVLMYTKGNPSILSSWQEPVAIDTEVTAVDALVMNDHISGTTTVNLLGFTDGSLALYIKDPLTQLWRQQNVGTPDINDVEELNTYTTRVFLKDQDGIPLRMQTVTLEPSFDCTARVNGEYYVLKHGVPKPVMSTNDGVIVITLETETLEAPVYTIKLEDITYKENPTGFVRDLLALYKTGNDIANARKTDGSMLFPNGVSAKKAESAAGVIQDLVKVYDSLPEDGSLRASSWNYPRNASVKPYRTVLTAVHAPGGEHQVMENAQEYMEAITSKVILLSPGDLLSALWSKIEELGSYFISKIGDCFEFIIEIGERVLGFVFEVGAQVFGVINWIMNDLFGFDLNDIVAWLGFVFDWKAILQTHKVMRKLFDLNLEFAKEQITKLEELTDIGFQKIRDLITGGLSVDTSDEIFQKRVRNNPSSDQKALDNPQESWASDHLSNGMSSAISSEASIIDNFTSLLVDMAATEGEILKNALQQVCVDLVEDFENLTWAQVIEKLLAIIGETIVNSVENVVITLLDASKMLIDVIKKVLETRIEIPVLTYVYEEIICQGDGSKLTIADVACLVTAVPSSIAFRAITGQPLFPDNTVQSIEDAKTFQDALEVLMQLRSPKKKVMKLIYDNYPSLQPSLKYGGLKENERTEFEYILVILQFNASLSRSLSTVCFGLKEFNPGLKKKAGEYKLAFDLLTFTYATIGTFIRGSGTHWKMSINTWIDCALTWSTSLMLIRDGFLVGYWRVTKTECPEFTRDVLTWCEGGYGVLFFIGVIVSGVLQLKGAYPSYLETDSAKKAWITGVVFKLIQNDSGSLYRIISPVTTHKDPRVKYAAKAARLALMVVQSTCSFTRFGLEFAYDFSDLDL